MKPQILAFLAICAIGCNSAPRSVLADAPQPGALKIALVSNVVSLGEPLLLKYQIVNVEDQRVGIYMGKRDRGWLRMSLNDASGHSAQAFPEPALNRNGLYTEGAALDPNGECIGDVVVSKTFQPTHAGQYRLSLSTHLIYSWAEGSEERYIDDQSNSLPLTVTARDPQRLRAVAEDLRQTVLHGSDYQLATQELFSMRDPECLPIWQELATDPTLDPWRAMDVARQIEGVGTTTAVDLLAEMQPVAPERWTQTGDSPYTTLQSMWHAASPEIKQRINERFAAAGFPPVTAHTRPVGEVN